MTIVNVDSVLVVQDGTAPASEVRSEVPTPNAEASSRSSSSTSTSQQPERAQPRRSKSKKKGSKKRKKMPRRNSNGSIRSTYSQVSLPTIQESDMETTISRDSGHSGACSTYSDTVSCPAFYKGENDIETGLDTTDSDDSLEDSHNSDSTSSNDSSSGSDTHRGCVAGMFARCCGAFDKDVSSTHREWCGFRISNRVLSVVIVLVLIVLAGVVGGAIGASKSQSVSVAEVTGPPPKKAGEGGSSSWVGAPPRDEPVVSPTRAPMATPEEDTTSADEEPVAEDEPNTVEEPASEDEPISDEQEAPISDEEAVLEDTTEEPATVVEPVSDEEQVTEEENDQPAVTQAPVSAPIVESDAVDEIGNDESTTDAAAATFSSIFINAGGTMNGPDDVHEDENGNVWYPDEKSSFTQMGRIYQQCPSVVSNTHDDALYCSERFFGSSTDGTYEIIVPANDEYQIVLHFAELYFKKANQRKFDIAVQGEIVESAYDIFAAAGGSFRATQVISMAKVTDGILRLDLFARGEGDPKINAIEVHHHTNARTIDSYTVDDKEPIDLTMVTVPLYINAGDNNITTQGDTPIEWIVEKAYPGIVVGGGSLFANCPAKIANTTLDDLYCSERWFAAPGGYEIPLATGTYEVTLHFAEFWYDAIGDRTFDITVQGQVVKSKFDILAESGGHNVAQTVSFVVDVGPDTDTEFDQLLSILFTPVTGNAKIGALSVVEATTVATASTVITSLTSETATR